jgi:hypothetical protein
VRRLISIAKFEAAIPQRKPGYKEAVLAVAKRASQTHLSVSDEDYVRLNAKYNPRPSSGPGTELKKLLKMIGITATPNCQCNQRAKVMDERGCDWCEENIETICEWLREESNKRGMLFVKSVVKLLVRRAISNARAVASKEIANG